MKIVFWIAYILTLAEFTASPINVLRGSAIHLQRFNEINFPLTLAKVLAVVEILGVTSTFSGVWVQMARHVGGYILATAFVVILPWAVHAKRPLGDLAGLSMFITTALIVALY